MYLKMYKLAKTALWVSIVCGDLISWDSCQGLETSTKAARHNTKPGSLHRKGRKSRTRNPPSRNIETYEKAPDACESPSNSKENSTSLDDNDEALNLNSTSVNSNGSKSTAGDLANNYEKDAVIGNNTSDIQNSTSFNFQNSSSAYNESHFNDSTADSTNRSSDLKNNLNSSSDEVSSGSIISELPQDAWKMSNLFLGFLPDDGSSGGTRQTIAQLNSQIGKKSAVYGWYAQAHSGIPFDGSQLLAIIDDVRECKCVFQPAIMPVDGWKGLTSWDNSQAVAMLS